MSGYRSPQELELETEISFCGSLLEPGKYRWLWSGPNEWQKFPYGKRTRRGSYYARLTGGLWRCVRWFSGLKIWIPTMWACGEVHYWWLSLIKECAGLECWNCEQRNKPKYHDTTRNRIRRVQPCDGLLLCKASNGPRPSYYDLLLIAGSLDPVHCARSTVKSCIEEGFPFKMVVENHDHLGYRS